MTFLEHVSKWNFNTWVVFLYFAIGVIFQIFWFFRITNRTKDPEEQVYYMYVSVLWCAFWPICFLKDFVFGGDE